MGTIVFDFETHDPDLQDKGSGYIWGSIEVLGMAYKVDDSEIQYTTDIADMVSVLSKNDTWVAHNISYELGICKHLGVDFKSKKIYCTRVGAYLDKNTRLSFSLEKLGSEILKKNKDQERFGRLVLEHNLPIKPDGTPLTYPIKYTKMKNNANKEPEDLDYIRKTEIKLIKQATNLAMQNLHIIQLEFPEIVEEYCKHDVEITYGLHKIWLTRIDEKVYNKFSDVNKVLVEMRHKGVRVDLEKAAKASEVLSDMIKEEESIVQKYAGDVNYGSGKQLAEVFDKLGIKYALTDKGNPKIDKAFMEKQTHPLCKAIVNAKKYMKAKEEFIGNIFKYQYKGRIHGEMKLFGAAQTGRFSHKNPNLGQIPSRDPIIGKMMRGIFVADEGEKWYSMDFSAQEPRLMVHYAALALKHKVKYKEEVYNQIEKKWELSKDFTVFEDISAYKLRDAYINDPKLDSHTYNMNIINETTGAGIDRSSTKTIALGLAYGMGTAKLCESLGVDLDEGKKLIAAFNKGSSWLKSIDNYCKYRLQLEGRIKTLGGRYSQADGASYKALNKLVQGSAADQTASAMLKLYYDYNIIPLVVVHDEINISGTMGDAKKVKHCMETAVKLEIPSMTDIGVGDNWAEAK